MIIWNNSLGKIVVYFALPKLNCLSINGAEFYSETLRRKCCCCVIRLDVGGGVTMVVVVVAHNRTQARRRACSHC